MKNRVLLAFVASVTACAAYAAEVTPDMAMAAADAWAERNAKFGTGNNATNVIKVCDTNAAQTILWHQVSMAGGGSLVIAPVTEIEPVIVALDNDPGELPAAHPLRAILMCDIRKRLRFLKLYEEDPPPRSGGRRLAAAKAESENVVAVRQEWGEQQQAKWDGLLTPVSNSTGGGRRLKAGVKQGVTDDGMPSDEIVIVKGFELGGALTHWNQSGGIFNKYTPGASVCGCVATAMGAMMQFFRVAETEDTKIEAGQANNNCTYNGGPVPGGAKTKGGVYDWKILPTNWGGEAAASSNLDANQIDLLGRVAYDAGVAVGMQWTKGSSGAIEANIATAFMKYFKFHEVRYVHNPTQDQYTKLIYAQNRSNAPVGMGIAQHSVVAAGYGIDGDGVERVRVFMGWGGSGDGWYSLPYIDTKSTEGGSTYLSEVVDGLITMIGYKDDNIVPVCGRLIPRINPPMTIGGTYYSLDEGNFHVFTNGFFGARVSASETKNSQVEIVCHTGEGGSKSGNVSIGADPGRDSSYMSSSAGVCNWVPEPIVFPLLNSEVALSFMDAREKSIASITNGTPKPVLAFSGKWGEPATDAAWNYLYWRDSEADDATKEAFTNLYVILCTQYNLGTLSESDGNPSIGLFDGRAISADANKIWSFHNGRLTHWSIGGMIFTNVENQVDNDLREFSVTNSVDGAKFIVTNSVEELLAQDADLIEAFELNGRAPARYITGWGITNNVETTLEVGRAKFMVEATGATVIISNDCSEAFAEWLDPDCGTYTMSNSVVFTAIASRFVTNAAQNVEFECKGCVFSWTNTNERVTGDDLAGIVTNEFDEVKNGKVFTTVTNGVYTIAWLWEPIKVKITTETIEHEHDTSVGSIEPGTGWFPIGKRVVFKAKPPDSSPGENWYFSNWETPKSNNLGAGDMYTKFGDELAIYVQRPVTIRAEFKCGTNLPDWGSFKLVVTNVCFKPSPSDPSTTLIDLMSMEVSEIVSGSALTNGEIVATVAPNTRHKGAALQNNATNIVQKLGITSMELAADALTGTDGQSYVCCGWRVTRLVEEFDVPTKTCMFKERTVDLVYSFDDYMLTLDGLLAGQLDNKALKATVSGIRTGDPTCKDKYPVENGDTLTLTWLWKLGTGDGVSKFYDIQWNDDLDNLKPNKSVDLLPTAAMDAKGWTTDDLVVTAPTGWIATVVNAGGMVSARLQRDDAALSSAMETCTLTVYSNDDGTGTYTVQADITEALRGFYYVLYGSNDLVKWDVITSGSESGTSAAQAQGTAANPVDSVTLYITVTPGDSGAGAKRFYKVVSGATATPLTTY